MKKIGNVKNVLFIMLFLWTLNVSAQTTVTFNVQAPEQVGANEQFSLTYEANAQGDNFKSGNLSAFTVLQGPSNSSSTSISIINGQMQRTTSISYTYILAPKKTGTFTISPGSITVDGKKYASNAVTIKVVAGNGNQSTAQTNTTVQGITDKDVFVRLQTNKRSVYKGEPIVTTIKLYTRVQLQQLNDYKIPQFDGFWKEEIKSKDGNTVHWQRENVNGVIYNSAIISQFVLVPQKAGKLTIDPVGMEVIALQEVQRHNGHRGMFNDPFFDDFFSQSNYQQVKKTLKSTPVKINVKNIPDEAQAVGDIKLSSNISKTEVKANESISLKITVSGEANLNMIEPFKINFPSDFEAYNPKTTQNIKVTTAGISGTKTFEYLIIPRHEGKYSIPPVSIECFNPSTGKVKRIATKGYEIKVNKGAPESQVAGMDYSQNQEDIKFLGKDIRYIKTNDFPLYKKSAIWFGSTSFYLSYTLSTTAFLFFVFFLRKQRKDSADQIGYKKRKAGALARKRLRIAEHFLKENDSAKYYEALLQGIWGYLGDKLSLQKSELSRHRIQQALVKRQVPTTIIEQLLSILEKCEMARYAPVGNAITLTEDYNTSVAIISSLEGEIRS